MIYSVIDRCLGTLLKVATNLNIIFHCILDALCFKLEQTKDGFQAIRVFICICPQHCERNSCHNVKTFILPSGFPAQIVTHIWRAKTKICSTFAFEFFLKFWTFVESIQSSFLFSFQKDNFFWNRTKIDVFTMFFPWNYFLYARIPPFLENGKQNVKVLWEDFRCHLILWVTMWVEFFSHCDSHCEKIVRKLWVEMNTLNVSKLILSCHPKIATTFHYCNSGLDNSTSIIWYVLGPYFQHWDWTLPN